jgi:predicted small lipoprotein YifL
MRAIPVLILSMALSACGLKGDLYLPEPRPAAAPPAADAANAANTGSEKTGDPEEEAKPGERGR